MSLGYFLDYHLSTDTTTWTEYNLGLALEPSNLKYLNSTWYLAGSKGVLRTTTPQIPSSWAPVHASLNNTLIQDMVYNPAEDRYVMVGGDRAYSYIGNAAPAVVFTGSSGLDFYRLAYGDGVYVATTYTPDQPSRVYRSVDAVNWNLVYTAPSVRVITDIVYGNNKFVAVGDEGKAYVSSDGVAWTQNNAVSDNSIALNSVIFAAGQFYTAGQREKVAVSTDGLSWQEDPGNSGIMADYADIAVADGKAVAAGYTQDFTTGIINTTTLAAAPAVNSVIVTPSTASVVQGSSEQLTVTVDVSGGAVDTVTWSSSDLAGNVSVSNTGLVTVSATATPGPYTITATSTEDSSKHGTATITVTEVPAVPVVNSVTVTPATASVVQGASEQLTATVSVSGGAADTVTWSSSDLAGNVSVSNTGLVTVSATATPGPYTITATSTEDSSKHGTATITVTEAPAVNSVIVTPSTASVVQGSSEQLTATVNVSGGAVDTVTWSSSDLTGNVSVSSTGLVTVSATATPGPYTITATSTEDNSKQGTSTITVTEAPAVNSVIVTPSTASVVQGASEQLTATVNVSGGAADTVTWSSSDPAGKVSVSNTGLVTVSATATPGPYTITATSTEDNSKRGTATITVTAAPVVPVEYTVHIANQAGGTITASPTTAVAGVPITVSVVPEAGKRLQPGSLKYIFDSGVFPISKGTFIMPAGDVTVTAEFEDIREQTPELIIAAPMFEQVRAGYARPAPRPLLMTNVGNTVAVIESVYSSDSDSFELHTGAIHVGVGETIDSWTIQPIAGLIAGTYSTVVSAVYGEGSIVTAAITFVVQPRRSGGSSSEGGDSTTPAPNTPGSNDPSPAEPLPNGVPVLVNGRAENIGTLDTTTVNNQTITTITPDPAKLLEWLEREGNNAVVTIPVHVVSEMTTAVLSGDIAQQLADRSAVLVFTTPSASYQLSASQLPIGDIAVDLGAEASLADVVFKLTITKANLEEKNLLQAASNQAGASWLLDPVHFTVTATYKNTTVDINRFSSYVRRDLLIPDTVDPKQITTGVVVGGDGSIHHVPTYVRQQDSQYYAVINSLTNSMYSLVWHPVTFADTVNHWAENAISDMGSRMIVTGVAPDKFEPTRYITRAEFAAMVVRALGLTPGKGDTTFTDVQASQWFAGYVQTAREYQLIEGYEDGRFAPQDHITREQAMTIISKAMILTGIQTTASKKQIEAELASFEDQSSIAGYARAHIAANLSHNIAKGRSASTLAPKGQITRAEVAQLLQNLLQKSELIQ
ncbi:Endo-1,4-beta-xylanase A precursor [compost metagenome]